MEKKHIVELAIDVPFAHTVSYLSDRPLEQGQRVKVPLAHRSVCGVVVDERVNGAVPEEKLKPIADVLTGTPPLPKEFFALIRFAARYYHYPFGQTLFTALPTALRQPISIVAPDERPYGLTPLGCREAQPSPRQKARLRIWGRLLAGPATHDELRHLSAQAPRLLAEWAQKRWIERVDKKAEALAVASAPTLNAQQCDAVKQVTRSLGQSQVWVLQGVTGSGKTEVYLRIIETVLQRAEQVLVLVPEINLTPQLIARFAQRFPNTRLAVLHSQRSDKERFVAWLDAWQGRAGIVVGTRLSVFVPCSKLGLIIVDEEHDGSFKQHEGLRYHARDLAVWRARQAGLPVLLGSATPSLETVANIEAGRYVRLRLTQRACEAAALPAIHLIDLRRTQLIDGLTEVAIKALQRSLAERQLSLVYINRRGFSPVLVCTACGWLSACSRCSARLVLHLSDRKLRCHHCGWEENIPKLCPDCGNVDIKPLGEGTQRVEAALARLFPEANIQRIDRDSTSRRAAWEKCYEQIQTGQIDILVGTQMLAKGHDFASLSLVVIVNADSGLYAVDYRASEWLFSQLIQVAGRAGRAGVPGLVLVQTRWPDHPLYRALVAHDVEGYAATLLTERRQAGFPPATYQAIVRADAPKLEQALNFLNGIRAQLQSLCSSVLLSGPAPCLMSRVANRERALLVLESAQRLALHRCLDRLIGIAPQLVREVRGRVRWYVDVDPQEY